MAVTLNSNPSPKAAAARDLRRDPAGVPFRTLRILAMTALGYGAWKAHANGLYRRFFTGPGRLSRILMLIFALLNLKNMPFVWTGRVWHAILYHLFFRPAPRLGPRSLFKPMISASRAPILEIDYYIHKSNSTYFSDLDVSRTHLVSHLCRPALRHLARNKQTQLIVDEDTGGTVPGGFAIMLGGAQCLWRREIKGYAPYEMWSRILSWDRKWLYMVTHFVPAGTARPTEWLDPMFGRLKTRGGAKKNAATVPGKKVEDDNWEKKVFATGLSKYVFKLGRWTIHPAIVLEVSELLPERPGGWRSGANSVGDESVDLTGVPSEGADWDWKMVEKRRRDGMVYAQQFANLEDLHGWFDGGAQGAVGKFGPG